MKYGYVKTHFVILYIMRTCYNHGMSLYKSLKDFCTDAYHELVAMGELPRPPYDSPVIARNPLYTIRLSKISSCKNLQQYMRSSDLLGKLHDVGHTWLWHEEVFEWLFLERVIGESSGTVLDGRVFDKVFRRAQAELSRTSFRIRRIVVLSGVPNLRQPIKLSPGVYLFPIDFSTHHYRLADLLGWRYQDRHRAPVFWIDPDSRLLIQTRTIKKGDDGKNLLDSLEQMRYEAEQVVKTLRLSLDTPVLCKQIFASYLSGFPLLPIDHVELEESKGFSVSVSRPIKRKEIRDIRTYHKFISQSTSGAKQEPQFFQSAIDRFADSFRFTHIEQSIVDLIVALEALFPVGEELRYRLAICVASLLGTNNRERKDFYRKVYAGYKLRNSIVHGRRNKANSMAKALREFFPELPAKTSAEVNEVNRYTGRAAGELQKIVRRALTAYIYMRTENTQTQWPTAGDLEYLPFDSQKSREVQKKLGIKPLR